MPYCSRLVGGLPLYVVLVFLKFAKFSKLSSLLVTFKLLVSEPNRQMPCGNLHVLPPILVSELASPLWPVLLLFHYVPAWPSTPWLQQQVVIHQVGWWACLSLFRFGIILPLSLLAALVLLEWPDLFSLDTSALRFFTSSWGGLMAVYRSMLSYYLVEGRLVYRSTCSVSVIFAVVRLVMEAQSSAEAFFSL